MPTNANTFNSRVTSEALEAKFRQVFPAQGGAELVQDLFASGVIQPVVDFSTVAEGSVLPVNLQTAWDFSTGHQTTSSTSAVLINNTGFWKVDSMISYKSDASIASVAKLYISDGLGTKTIMEINENEGATNVYSVTRWTGVVFLRAGDSLAQSSANAASTISTNWRQIADVNGNLVNPLGFTFS